ncbi:hypothetical protein BCR39DRAFT_520955 [Naematelia encephala]|uniref:Uncharacterized protein n=1 Tax=Naematelia encephala TaxID=71784 RepID=A0A1Y2BDZ4_9TREE|nr:hypothetical protein BCR39DRAFT_520955 [Naematelia encephala]
MSNFSNTQPPSQRQPHSRTTVPLHSNRNTGHPPRTNTNPSSSWAMSSSNPNYIHGSSPGSAISPGMSHSHRTYGHSSNAGQQGHVPPSSFGGSPGPVFSQGGRRQATDPVSPSTPGSSNGYGADISASNGSPLNPSHGRPARQSSSIPVTPSTGPTRISGGFGSSPDSVTTPSAFAHHGSKNSHLPDQELASLNLGGSGNGGTNGHSGGSQPSTTHPNTFMVGSPNQNQLYRPSASDGSQKSRS